MPDVIDAVSQQRSSWTRADVLQAICDVQRPVSKLSGHGWAATLERAADRVVGQLVDLDPTGETSRRSSDGRSVWIEPTAPRFTSDPVLAQEEAIVTWATAAQADPPAPSTTVNRDRLDTLQGDAAAAVAGNDRLVLVVGPAGAAETRMLTAAAQDLRAHGRAVFAVAPTAKAARTIARDTGIPADTVTKLLHEWHRSDRPPLTEFQLPVGSTLILDEPARSLRQRSTRSCRSPTATGGDSRSSATRDSSKASAAAGCSPSSAPTAASTNSNAYTDSAMNGKRTHP